MSSGLRDYLSPLRGNLLVLVSSMIVWHFTLQMVSTYQPIYVFAIGGTGASLGIITALQTLFSTFFRIPGGYLADKRGRGTVIGVVTVISALGYLFYVFANDWTWLLPGAFFLAMNSICEPAVEAIKADSVRPEERGKGYALLNTLPQIPAMFAPAIGGLLIVSQNTEFGIDVKGIKTAYLLIFGSVVLAGLIRLFFLRDIYDPNESEDRRILDFRMFRDVYLTIINSPSSVKRLLLLSGFFMFCFHLDVQVRSVYAVNLQGLSTIEWGSIVSTSILIATATIFIIGWLVDRYGRKWVFVLAVASLSLSSLIFAISSSFPGFLLAMIIEAVGTRARIIAFQVLVADATPISIRGRVMGAINILISLGGSTAILFSGFIYDWNPVLPFYIAAIMYGVATLVAIKLISEPIRREI